jgi:hypothetical protein
MQCSVQSSPNAVQCSAVQCRAVQSSAVQCLLYKTTIRSVIDYALPFYYHTLRQTEMKRLSQIQYRAAKLVTGALHYSSQVKLEADLAWESIDNQANFLGITLCHKINLHLTRPLIKTCMSELNTYNTRMQFTYFSPYISAKHSKSFFP